MIFGWFLAAGSQGSRRFFQRVTPRADSAARLDKWLWAVRLFKTRSLAASACRAGSVFIDSRPAKPARDVRAGESIDVMQGVVKRTLIVLGVPASRVGASAVKTYYEETTPA